MVLQLVSDARAASWRRTWRAFGAGCSGRGCARAATRAIPFVRCWWATPRWRRRRRRGCSAWACSPSASRTPSCPSARRETAKQNKTKEKKTLVFDFTCRLAFACRSAPRTPLTTLTRPSPLLPPSRRNSTFDKTQERGFFECAPRFVVWI
jgi:hypothetical protein